jgi:hypothetical protein
MCFFVALPLLRPSIPKFCVFLTSARVTGHFGGWALWVFYPAALSRARVRLHWIVRVLRLYEAGLRAGS